MKTDCIDQSLAGGKSVGGEKVLVLLVLFSFRPPTPSRPLLTGLPSPRISPSRLRAVLSPPNLLVDFGLSGAHRLDVLLVQHNVIGPGRQGKYALLGCRHAMEKPQKQVSMLSRFR